MGSKLPPSKGQVRISHSDLALQARARLIDNLERVPREVLDLLSTSEPLKPYDLLWKLQKARGRPAPPSTIYRALTILVESRLAHRIGIIGAYVLCSQPGTAHDPAFLICERCGNASEVDASSSKRELEAEMKARRFTCNSVTVIVRGVCASCNGAA